MFWENIHQRIGIFLGAMRRVVLQTHHHLERIQEFFLHNTA